MPDETFDVVVAGFGFAGGISALNAAQRGAKTLLLEKSTQPGGLSICSYGAVRSASDPDKAFQYLKATNDGRTPDDVVRALAQGMCDIERYVRELAKINNAKITTSRDQAPAPDRSNTPYIHEQKPQRRNSGNYPLPGTETFYHTTVEDVPGFDARQTYPWANGAPDGPKLFKIVHDNLLKHGVEIRLATPVRRLIADPQTREVRGVRVAATAPSANILRDAAWFLRPAASRAMPACGSSFSEGKPILNAAGGSNTGDGIRMAQHLGAALWHMWHIHGSYGFRHSDPNYPYAIRLKRFPDWFPGDAGRVKLKMPWILVDQDGRRFMSEQQPYTQDTAVRPMQYYDPRHAALPAQSGLHDLRRGRPPALSARQADLERRGRALRLERRQSEGGRARHPQARRLAFRTWRKFSASMPRLWSRASRDGMRCASTAAMTISGDRPAR